MTTSLDRVTDAAYLGDLSARSIDEIRDMRTECQAVETGLSYLRRLIQGRHDLVASEAANRESGGGSESLIDLIAHLPDILADRERPAGNGRLPQSLGTGDVDPALEVEVDAAIGPGGVSAMDQLSDDDLAAASQRLAALERQVSDHRRVLFDRLDALQAELARRYKSGEASVESLLH
jgi:hypothetical protein